MVNTRRALKVASAWISIIYAVCYAGVAIYPQSRELFMRYSLHADVSYKSDYLGIGYFISGLVIWNILAISFVWLLIFLLDKIKE